MNGTEITPHPAVPSRRASLFLFAAVLLFQLLFASGHVYSYDEVVALETAVNLVERGDAAIEFSPERRLYTKPGRDGRLYSKFGIGMSAALVPAYALGKGIAVVAGAEEPGKAAEILACFTNAVLVAGLSLLFFQALVAGGIGAAAAGVTAILLSASSTLAVYGRGLFNDPLTGLAVLLAYRAFTAGRLELCGLAAGIAAATRAEYAIVVPVFALFAGRRMLRVLVPAALCGAVLALYNHGRFGSATDQGTLTEHPTDRFDTPLHVGLYGLLLSPGKGLLWYSPVVLFALFGARDFLRSRRREALLVAGLVLPLLVVHALWHSWMGGWSFGPRRLVALLPLIMIPAGFAVARFLKTGTGRLSLAALGLTGFAVQAGGLTTNFMTYIARAGDAQVSVLWNPLYTPAAGQLYAFLSAGERDLWYFHLLGRTAAAQLVAGVIFLFLVAAGVALARSLAANPTPPRSAGSSPAGSAPGA